MRARDEKKYKVQCLSYHHRDIKSDPSAIDFGLLKSIGIQNWGGLSPAQESV